VSRPTLRSPRDAVAAVLLGWTVVGASLLAAPAPQARAQDDPGEPRPPAPEAPACLDEAIGALGPGVAAIRRGAPRFLVPGMTETLTFDAPASHPCVVVLGVSERSVTDVDARLFTAGGIGLTADERPRSLAFVRHCGAAGVPLRVALEVASGAGEVHWAILGTPAGPAPRFDRVDSTCFGGSAGLASGPPRIGAEPTDGSDEAADARLDRALAARGYQPLRLPVRRTVSPREPVPVALPARAGTCYAATASGGAGVLDVDLFVQDPAGRIVAVDDGPSPSGALVEWCARQSGVHRVLARAHRGRGEVTVRTHLHRPPGAGPPAPSDLEGAGVVSWTDLGGHLAQRGFGVVERRWGWLAPDDRWSVPTDLGGGRCHALGVLAKDGGRGTLLELTLLDRHGRVLAEDAGVGGSLRVHHCPDTDLRVRLEVRLIGRPGPVLFVRAEDDPQRLPDPPE